MRKTRRIVAILLIIVLALAVGIATDRIWTAIDENEHPQLYAEYVSRYATEYNVPEYIIYAVIKVESGFDPGAKSSAGALGLMQMMPDTFTWLTGDEHLGEHLDFGALTQPEVSIRYGTYYLRYLHTKFDHRWDTVFAAYHGWEGNVSKWLADPDCTDEDGVLTYIPIAQTRSYVSKVNDAVKVYQTLYYEPNEGVST